MSLAYDVIDNLTGYSKAMYSTWFYYKAERFLFDAGEGVSTTLGNKIFGIKNVFLSHGHYDHIGGLAGIVLTRNSAMGDKTKPLAVYYPKNDNFIELQKEYIRKCCYNLTYDLTWHPLDKNDEVHLDSEAKNRFIRCFPTDHARGHLTLGYNLLEKRSRLKKKFLELPQSEIVKLVKDYGQITEPLLEALEEKKVNTEQLRCLLNKEFRREDLTEELKKRNMSDEYIKIILNHAGKSFITENYEYIVLSYVGDSMPVCPDDVRGAEVLMHEASFVDNEERKYDIHSTLEEAINVAQDAQVKSLILYHISSRYNWDEINKKLYFIMKKKQLAIPVIVVISSHFRNLSPGKISGRNR
ncbi:MAG: MBL fold metallo-hydrolase [Candidatus Eremiobacterota bacterium]